MSDSHTQLAPIGTRTPEQILELLGRRFRPDAIKGRKVGGGRTVQYIPVEAVIERLNKACNTWQFRVVSRDRETMVLNRWSDATRKSEPKDVSVSVVTGELEIPELGIRQAIGVQALDDGSGEDLLKGAGSDALKKCASLFGVRVEGSDYGFGTPPSADQSTGEIQAPAQSRPAASPHEEAPAPVESSQPAQTTPQLATQSASAVDYSDEGEWKYWSRKAHGEVKKIAPEVDPHDALHAWATKEGFASTTNVPPSQFKELAERIAAEPDTARVWASILDIPKPSQSTLESDITTALANATPSDAEPVSDADYMAGKGTPESPRPVEIEPTERQRKLIDVLVHQLDMDDNELRSVCRNVTGEEVATLSRKGASAFITELQRLKQETLEQSKVS